MYVLITAHARKHSIQSLQACPSYKPFDLIQTPFMEQLFH